MPQPNVPDTDFDLLDVPPAPAVHYAEQALLGALLLEPDRIKTLGTLHPADFANAGHLAVFHAVTTLTPPPPDVHASKPVWLTAVLEHTRPAARGLTASYLHQLVSTCPDPAHAPAYAAIVRAGHARRTLTAHAEQLVHTAGDPMLEDQPTAALTAADTLAGVLDHLAGRFPAHSSPLPRTPAPAHPVRDPDHEDVQDERLLLAALCARPRPTEAARWLQPGDFLDPLHGRLFGCLLNVARRGDPIDPVTVLWEAQHQGLITPALPPAELLGILTDGHGVAAEHWAEVVLRRAMLARAHTTGLTVLAYTQDDTNTVHQLLAGTRRALADLAAVRARWHRATDPTLPRTTQSAGPAPPRAGPVPLRPTATTRAAR
ncbi:DnaB-like helicase N-terminal domain-containing protein [Streptomyces sp. NBC_01439]|uniref:DnaB-like helicase N-terminal domain-containing protein n=1 Tax=Streptomyces sp. NBC_01439 TaxID=2903867 RepID=UPI002E28A22F|nr:DnaB-like helicase N-terminal domain-containing protein [Streptomyces sp. NBC_01439]